MYLIGIISYLPNETKLRQKRLKSHIQQLKELRNIFKDIFIYDVLQNYTEDEIKLLDVDEYKVFDTGIGAGPARNEVLDYYYNSNYNTLLMLDDDTSFYNYYNIGEILEDIEALDDKRIGLVTSLIPMLTPFKEINYQYEKIINNNFILHTKFQSLTSIGATYIITKYLKEKRLHFENLDPTKNEGYEDMDFYFKVLDSGFAIYKCNQLIMKLILMDDSTIFKNREGRQSLMKNNMKVMYEKYKYLGLELKTPTSFNLDKVYYGNNIDVNMINVPRKEKYIFTEDVKYVPKNIKILEKNSLF